MAEGKKGVSALDPKVKQLTKQLADALSASEEYQAVQSARATLAEHQAAQIMLRDLQTKQQKIAEKFERGEQPTEVEIADFERTAEMVGLNPYIRQLFEAEMTLSEMLGEIQRAIARAVGIEIESPEGPETGASPGEIADAQGQTNEPPPPSKRLWTPGS